MAILRRFGAAIISGVLRDLCRPSYKNAVLRESLFPNEENSPDAYEQGSSIICVVSYQQAQHFLSGKSSHILGAFAKGKCNCKSKTHVLTNFRMRPHGIACLEKSGFGLQSLVGKAPALGLALAREMGF